MATKPLTTEAVALTEKKMDMALDDIIKMSKTSIPKNNKQKQWVPILPQNKSQKVFNGGGVQRNFAKVGRYLDSRSSLRQGFLAQRRSNFRGNQFPVATEVARKAAAAPIRNRPYMNNRIFNRKPNWVGAIPVQRKGMGGGFAGKSHQAKVVPKQKPQTLDALFANMKEQRMKVHSGRNSAQWGGSAQQKLQRGRNRFGN